MVDSLTLPEELKKWAQLPFGEEVQTLSWFLFGITALGATFAIVRRLKSAFRGDRRRYHWAAIAWVCLFVVLVLYGREPAPLHDHLCNMARFDCAAKPDCDVVHGAWSRQIFHTMGLLLRLIPYRLESVLGLGVVLTGVCLALSYHLTALLARRLQLSRPEEAGLWTLVVLSCQPAIWRLAGAGSFWPLSMAFLLGAGVLYLGSRESESTLELWAAGASFGLALGGHRYLLLLAPVAVIAAICWPRKGSGFRLRDTIALLPALLVGAQASIDHIAADYPYGTRFLEHKTLWQSLGQTSVATESLVGWPVAVAAGVGLFVGPWGTRRQTAPLAATLGVLLVTPAVLVAGPLWKAYPDIYLKHFPGMLMAGPAAGLGLARLISVAPTLRATPLRILAATVILGVSLSRPDAMALYRATRVMELELVEMNRAFALLPPHNTLIYQVRSLPANHHDIRNDPLEMHFPLGQYRHAMEERGLKPGTFYHRTMARFVGPTKALVYIGSTQRSFYPGEIERGEVPASLLRAETTTLLRSHTLEPVVTFKVPTEQPEEIPTVVGGGRVSEIELGFYWARRRTPTAAPKPKPKPKPVRPVPRAPLMSLPPNSKIHSDLGSRAVPARPAQPGAADREK